MIILYFNPTQKYIIELLREYGALKKSQFEIMAKYHVNEHLLNLDGYIKQLHQGKEIKIIPCGKSDMYIYFHFKQIP